MSALAPQNWFPNERPGKPEIAIAVVLLLDLAYDFYEGEPVVWPWFAAGFVVCILALGPLAASSVGSRVGVWFRRVGAAGQMLAIAAFAVAVWAAYEFSLLPRKQMASAADGLFLAVVVFIAARTLHARIGEHADEG